MADMIPEKGPTATPKKRRTPRRYAGCQPKTKRPTLDPARIYTRREAALALGVSTITLIRARDNGNLQELRVGARCLHSGQQLIDFLNAGGKTGWVGKPREGAQ